MEDCETADQIEWVKCSKEQIMADGKTSQTSKLFAVLVCESCIDSPAFQEEN